MKRTDDDYSGEFKEMTIANKIICAVLLAICLAGLLVFTLQHQSGYFGSRSSAGSADTSSHSWFPLPHFRSPYVGTWKESSFGFTNWVTFASNGTGYTAGTVWGSHNFTWRTKGDRVIISGWDDRYSGKLSPDGKFLELYSKYYSPASCVKVER